MIVVIFILLCFALYMFKHFENKRELRDHKHAEKRLQQYHDLLSSLQEKDRKEQNTNTENI